MADLITAYDIQRHEADQKARHEAEAAAAAAEVERLRKSFRPPAAYTRQQVADLFAAHRRGAYKGREIEWSWIERDILQASRTGRIVGAIGLHGRGEKGPPR